MAAQGCLILSACRRGHVASGECQARRAWPGPDPAPLAIYRRMLDELIRSNAVDKRWAEELITGAATLEDLERAAIGTADNRWRIPRFNGRACVNEARHMARL